MSRARDFLLLLRPAQWPILSCQLAVGVLASVPAAAVLHGRQLPPAALWPPLLAAWAAWVVLLNGGTLAFNSAHDRDTGAVAYLRRPPVPPAGAAAAAVLWMLGGVALAASISAGLAALTATCVALSVLYSHPATRWKGIPGADLAVNMAGYGGGTTLAGLLAGQRALGGATAGPDGPGWLLVAGFALMFGSLYPLTQIYQVGADTARGDRTLATALGAGRSLGLSVVLGALGGAALVGTVVWRGAGWWATAPAAAVACWLLALARWRRRAVWMSDREHERGMYGALAIWAVVDAAMLLALLAPAG